MRLSTSAGLKVNTSPMIGTDSAPPLRSICFFNSAARPSASIIKAIHLAGTKRLADAQVLRQPVERQNRVVSRPAVCLGRLNTYVVHADVVRLNIALDSRTVLCYSRIDGRCNCVLDVAQRLVSSMRSLRNRLVLRCIRGAVFCMYADTSIAPSEFMMQQSCLSFATSIPT